MKQTAWYCRLVSFFIIVAMMLGAVARGEESFDRPELLVLINGDRMLGNSVGFVGGMLRWRLPPGNEITVPVELVDHVDLLPPVEELDINPKADEAADAETGESVIKDSDVEPAESIMPVAPEIPPAISFSQRFYESGQSAYQTTTSSLKVWTKRFELGGQVADGNTETTEFYTSGKFERKTDRTLYQIDGSTRHATANQRVTQDKITLNSTLDFAREGNWILFVSNKNLLDRLADVDYRGTFAGGIGYRFIDENDKRFILRLGPGATIERQESTGFRTNPDLFGEAEYQWPIFQRTFVEYKGTFTPSLEDVSILRMVNTYGLLIRLDEGERWSFRFGVRHDYNSSPSANRKPSDFLTTFSLVYIRK